MDEVQDAAFWKRHSRKHERRAKKAIRLAQRLAEEIRTPTGDRQSKLAEIEAQLDQLSEERRSLRHDSPAEFRRPVPNEDGTSEIIVARHNKRRAPAPAKRLAEEQRFD